MVGLVLGLAVASRSQAVAALDGGTQVTGDLWVKAVLKPPGRDVALTWQMAGADVTPGGGQVISGCFYADPADFAYGSQYNPGVFFKVYIDPTGWTNMAFNHVTVDPVDISSAHGYAGLAEQSGTVTLSGRLLEHSYTGVATQ